MSVHFKIPFQLVGSSFATVAQDSEEEIVQSVAVIVGTVSGERPMVPEFGLRDDPAFGLPHRQPSVEDIEIAVARWDERADISVEIDEPTSDGVVPVSLRVSKREEE